MKIIKLEQAQKKVADAAIICSPEFGYFIGFERKNPYEKLRMQIPFDYDIILTKHIFGELLKIKKENKVMMIAFLFDPDFLPDEEEEM